MQREVLGTRLPTSASLTARCGAHGVGAGRGCEDPSLEETGIAGITGPKYLFVLDDNTEQEPPLPPYFSQSRLLLMFI